MAEQRQGVEQMPYESIDEYSTALLRAKQELQVERAERNDLVEKLDYLDRALRALRGVNQLIVGEKNLDRLLRNSCKLLVETLGYQAAWIATQNDKGEPTAWAEACWGEAFAQVSRSLEKGQWPQCRATASYRDGLIAVVDPAKDCCACPLFKRDAHDLAVVVLLRHGDKNLGMLGASFPRGRTTGQDEQSLLVEIAGTIALTLSTIETEVERRKSEERYRNFLEHNVAGVYRYEARRPMPLSLPIDEQVEWMMDEGVLVEANARTASLQGIESIEPLIGMTLREIFRADHRALKKQIRDWAENGYVHDGYESLETTVSGERRWFSRTSRGIIENDHLLGSWGMTIDITERKRTEIALAESEAKFRQLSEKAVVGIYVIQDGRLVYVNPSLAATLGYSPQEMIGRLTLADVIHPDDIDIVIKRFSQRLAGETEKENITYKVVKKDGTQAFIEVYGQLIEYHDRPAVLGTMIDVTDRQQARSRYQAIFDSTNTAILVSTLDGAVIEANQAFLLLSGYSRDDLRAINIKDFYTDPDDRNRLLETFRQDGQLRDHEVRVVTKSGQQKWVSVSGRPFFQLGQTCLLSVIVDITERRQAEMAVRQSEQKHRSIVDNIGIGVSLISPDMKILELNRQMRKWFPNIVSDQHPICYKAFYSPPRDQVCDDCPTFETLQDGKVHEATSTTPHPDGVRNYRIISSPVLDARGEITAAIEMVEDITEFRQMQTQVAQSDRLASMGMLAAGVAHEINNPLSYVLYNLESLTEDLPEVFDAMRGLQARLGDRYGLSTLQAAAGESLKKMNQSVLSDIRDRFSDALDGSRRIRDIVKGLSTFSRVEEDNLVSVSLIDVIEIAANMAFNEIKYRARLIKDYSEVPNVMASEGRLSQVFLNLFINAAHAIDEGDVENNTIEVRTWAQDDAVFVNVRDTGKGVAPEYLDKLFEPFFTTKKIELGSGLGLAISKNIVESYKGSIHVRSELGKGTTFTIRLPAYLEQSVSKNAVSGAPFDSAVHGRILIVDDEEKIRDVVARMLRRYVTIKAANGADARRILQNDQNFDLILCDMMMSDVSGMDLHEWLAKDNPRLARQFVFITGGAFTSRASAYLDTVDNIWIEKPFDATNFRTLVAELIRNSKEENPES